MRFNHGKLPNLGKLGERHLYRQNNENLNFAPNTYLSIKIIVLTAFYFMVASIVCAFTVSTYALTLIAIKINKYKC